MSETPKRWPELYREALLESDPRKVPARIEEAHQAICRRALALSCAGSIATQEHRDLERALHFLDLLRLVGPTQAELAACRHSGEPLRPRVGGGGRSPRGHPTTGLGFLPARSR